MVIRVPIRRLAMLALACASMAAMSAPIATTTAAAQGSGPPLKTVLPSVQGKPFDGRRLKAATGKWTGAATIAHAYAWERCNASGGECEPVSGAVTNRYPLAPADVGHTLIVAETAFNGEGSDVERSTPSAVIGPVAPKHKGPGPPRGEGGAGRGVRVGPGPGRGPPPFESHYQWSRWGKGCVALSGAPESSYRATTADIGKKLKAVITATNAA